MPRSARRSAGGVVYHVLNRGNGRQRLFHKPGDYDAFVELLTDVKAAVPGVRVLAYCLMPNHWHLVLWPRDETYYRRNRWAGAKADANGNPVPSQTTFEFFGSTTTQHRLNAL